MLLYRDYPQDKRRKLMLFVKEILRLPTELEQDFITFAKIKVQEKMATKKNDNSVKGRLKQAEKEWAEVFAEVQYDAPLDLLMQFGAPEEVLLKNKAAQKDAEAERKIQGAVLHLYHTIGLTVIQIAGTINISADEVQKILNDTK